MRVRAEMEERSRIMRILSRRPLPFLVSSSGPVEEKMGKGGGTGVEPVARQTFTKLNRKICVSTVIFTV